MYLSLQIGLSFATTVDVCADLAMISVLDPSDDGPRVIKLFHCFQFLSIGSCA